MPQAQGAGPAKKPFSDPTILTLVVAFHDDTLGTAPFDAQGFLQLRAPLSPELGIEDAIADWWIKVQREDISAGLCGGRAGMGLGTRGAVEGQGAWQAQGGETSLWVRARWTSLGVRTRDSAPGLVEGQQQSDF